MNVCQSHAIQMKNAPTVLVAMSVPARMDTLKMGMIALTSMSVQQAHLVLQSQTVNVTTLVVLITANVLLVSKRKVLIIKILLTVYAFSLCNI